MTGIAEIARTDSASVYVYMGVRITVARAAPGQACLNRWEASWPPISESHYVRVCGAHTRTGCAHRAARLVRFELENEAKRRKREADMAALEAVTR